MVSRLIKLGTAFVFIVTIDSSFAQEKKNQVDDKGRMTGLWVEYYKNSQQIIGDTITRPTSWTAYKHATIKVAK